MEQDRKDREAAGLPPIAGGDQFGGGFGGQPGDGFAGNQPDAGGAPFNGAQADNPFGQETPDDEPENPFV